MEKLSVKGLAVGLGVSWATCMLFAGWASIFGWCTKFVEIMSSIYIGFKPSFLGGIIGAIWGFADGAIGGAIIAIVYNAVTTKK
ncbi:MAG: bacteriophage holin [Deltaproteobacteria bacterium]|nr:bacteriophage holin [Deltaproteobacteria bacterium]MBW2072333.1 bacteriophage holin [Deltaproteobacteria bacterium]